MEFGKMNKNILSSMIVGATGGSLFGTGFYLQYKRDIKKLKKQYDIANSKIVKEKIQNEIDYKRNKLVKDVIKWSLTGVVLSSLGFNIKNIYKIIKKKWQIIKFKKEFAKELDKEIEKIKKNSRLEQIKKEKFKTIFSKNLEKEIDHLSDAALKENRIKQLEKTKEETLKQIETVEKLFKGMEKQFKKIKIKK